MNLGAEHLGRPENGRDQKYDWSEARDDAGNVAKPRGRHSKRDGDQRSVKRQQQKSWNCEQRGRSGPATEIDDQDDIDRKIIRKDDHPAPDKTEDIEQIRKPELLDIAFRTRKNFWKSVGGGWLEP